jgi:hypothetical protein
MTQFQVGDTVAIPNNLKYAGQLFKVTRVKRIRLIVQATSGYPHTVDVPMDMVVHSTDASVTMVPLSEDEPERFVLGQVVQIMHKDYASDQRYVVIKTSGSVNMQVAKLGGDDGRFVRVHPSLLKAWNAIEVTEEKGLTV